MKTKRCPSCGATKDLSDFPLGSIRRDGSRYGCGRAAHCKSCQSSRMRKLRAAMSAEQKACVAEKEKEWRRNHPHALRARWANQRANEVGSSGFLTEKDVTDCWDNYRGKCWVCGDIADQLDHYRPINKHGGGTNTADNIRPICRECNQKRSHRWFGDSVARKEATLLRKLKALFAERNVP